MATTKVTLTGAYQDVSAGKLTSWIKVRNGTVRCIIATSQPAADADYFLPLQNGDPWAYYFSVETGEKIWLRGSPNEDTVQTVIVNSSTTNDQVTGGAGGGDATAANQTTMIAALNSIKPASAAVAVTPHDTNNLGTPSRSIFVGGAGNISLQVNGSAVVFNGVAAGTIIPIIATRVNLTGTTATNIVSLS